MRSKKILLLLIIFLTLLGTGTMLSNVQSQEANQLLEAYGLSNNTRSFEIKNSQSVSDFLKYLEKTFPQNKIQLHLTSKRKDNQTLVWSNHDVLTLPTESGRYFTLDDFKGRVSFGVLGLNAKVPTLKTQNNEYINLNNTYYSVIGTLKHYRRMKQNGYYLTTGTKQPTGNFKLKDYTIIIDSSNKVIRKIARHYDVKVKTPVFVRKHQKRQLSVIKEFLFIILLVFVATIANIILAYLDWQTVKATHLKGSLLRNWLANHGFRIILVELLLSLGAYFFLCWRAFYSNREHLLILLLGSWGVVAVVYSFFIFLCWRKEKTHA